MTQKDLLEGKIATTGKGIGYVSIPNLDEDMVIEEGKLGTALPGDFVRVRPSGKNSDGRDTGEVVAIIKRAREQFVGAVKEIEEKKERRIRPDSHRIYTDFILDEKDSKQVATGDKVLVYLISWNLSDPCPKVGLLKVLGKKGEHEAEMQSIIFEKGFDAKFPEKVDAEAERLKKTWTPIPPEEIALRRDLRAEDIFTIDPYDAKDFDDAVHVRRLENGNFEVGVHIADVSHYVTPGTALDDEAFERATSVYMVDRTVPMLPEILSNDLCSLNPNEEKLAFSAIFEMTPKTEIRSRWFGRTVIESKRRFTYEEAQAILDAGKEDGDHYLALKTMDGLAKILRQENKLAGAIEFEKEEIKFVLDKKGRPLKIIKKDPLETHKLIENMMLLANREVAKYIYDTGKKFGGDQQGLIYRIHDVPNREKIADLSAFLKALGYHLITDHDGDISATSLNELFQKIENTPEEQMIKSAAIKTMSKAVYSTENIGHFGLAFQYYTHFTSPIRRYPDLLVHRILATFLAGKKLDQKDLKKLATGATHATGREINAAEAERDSIKYKQAEYMQDHIGEEFDGVVSNVAPWGIYVQLKDTLTEGLVHISKLGDDYFNLDEKNYAIVGERTGAKFKLSDQVRVKINSVDLDKNNIDLSLVESQKLK